MGRSMTNKDRLWRLWRRRDSIRPRNDCKKRSVTIASTERRPGRR